LAPPQSRLRPLAYAVLLAIVVANPPRMPLVHLRSEGETLRDMLEGAGGIVTVTESGGDLQLGLDNYYVLGRSAAAVDERRQGLLPLLLHPIHGVSPSSAWRPASGQTRDLRWA
jgi:hypothetical protein